MSRDVNNNANNDADESRLLAAAQRGEHDAFVDLLALHDRQIMSVVYRFTCDQYDREDLYQEVFLHCFRSIGQFRGRSSFRTWLYRLSLNRCVSYMQKKPPLGEPPPDAPGPAIDFVRREKLAAVHRALARLKGPQRICFHLHYVEQWRVEEIAELLDCRPGTVKSHLNRARGKVRQDDEVLTWQTNL